MSPYLLIMKKNTNEMYVTQHLHVCLVFSHVKEKGGKKSLSDVNERKRKTNTNKE